MCAAVFAWAVLFTGAAVHAETNLRIGLETLPRAAANPHSTALSPTIYSIAALYDGLTRFDAGGRLLPALSERWERIDALTWRFHLRKDVLFSNGAPLTSDAFVTAINYLASTEAAKENLKEELGVLKSARAVDDFTFEVVTTEPVAAFPRYASGLLAAEPEAWRRLGRDGFSRAPIGTGPFKIDTIETNRWKLSASEKSWRRPKVDTLEILSLPEPSSRVQALAAGRIDVAMTLGPDNIAPLEEQGAKVLSFVGPTVTAFAMMTTRAGPFADRRVRQAISLAINRERITTQLFAGRTAPTGQPAPPTAWGFDPEIKPDPYDPTRAKALLAEAGFGNGLTFTFDAPASGTASDTLVFQQIQSDLRDIGVTMNIASMPFQVFLRKVLLTEFEGDAFPINWTSWPAFDVLRAMRSHSCMRPVPWYCDQAVMPDLVAAMGEPDEQRGIAMRRKLSRYYHDNVPSVFLYNLPLYVGVSDKVVGFDLIGYRIAYDQIALKP